MKLYRLACFAPALAAVPVALLAALSPAAAAAPMVNFTPCTTAMEQRAFCVAGDVVEVIAWPAAEWDAVRLPELAASIGYQPEVECAAERVVDVAAGGVLLVAGVGDGQCTAELVGRQRVPNPQPVQNAVRRALHAREVLADYQRRVKAAEAAARAAVPFPAPGELAPDGGTVATAGGTESVTAPPSGGTSRPRR